MADVGHDLVHGYAAEEGRFLAVDEEVGVAARDGARETVAIADADGSYGGILGQNAGAAVANAVTSRESADEADS